ncbi:MAG: cysteine hydrolase [bacterium]|nr:cysteine hydrolase [bacterium]
MKRALIIIDIQNDYFPGGSFELEGTAEASANAAKLLEYFRSSNLPIAHVQHQGIGENAPFFKPATKGMEINSSVEPLPGEEIILKFLPNSFRNTGLEEFLKTHEIGELVVCGMMSHMCIEATVRASFDLGYKNILVHDACATRALEFNGKTVSAEDVHTASMAALSFIYAEPVSTADLISA